MGMNLLNFVKLQHQNREQDIDDLRRKKQELFNLHEEEWRNNYQNYKPCFSSLKVKTESQPDEAKKQ